VALQHIDVIDVQPLQAGLHRCEDVLNSASFPGTSIHIHIFAHLARESVAVDISRIVPSSRKNRTGLIPDDEEDLLNPSSAGDRNAGSQENTNFGHDDDVLPWDVMHLECLSDNTFRFSVRVYVCGIEGVDAVVVSMR
jgi:hypothetical protein